MTTVTIKNKTRWNTRQLAAIARRAIKGYYDKPHLTIYVRPARRWQSGCAWLRSRSLTIRVPVKRVPNKIYLAGLIAHEAAHCMGVDHEQMRSSYRELLLDHRGNWHDRFAWAADMPLEPKPKPAPRPKPTGVELAEKKHAHALAKVQEWETKSKRASTILKKWRAKVRYHERRMAALREEAE